MDLPVKGPSFWSEAPGIFCRVFSCTPPVLVEEEKGIGCSQEAPEGAESFLRPPPRVLPVTLPAPPRWDAGGTRNQRDAPTPRPLHGRPRKSPAVAKEDGPRQPRTSDRATDLEGRRQGLPGLLRGTGLYCTPGPMVPLHAVMLPPRQEADKAWGAGRTPRRPARSLSQHPGPGTCTSSGEGTQFPQGCDPQHPEKALSTTGVRRSAL